MIDADVQATAERARPRGRILLIDDNESFRASVRAILEHAGYDVDEAGDGREALHKYSERPADLIITDMVMPGMNGMETMLEVWRDYPQARFIAMSGSVHAFNTEFNLECAREFGALHTFTKPIEREPFLSAVAQALGNGRESPDAAIGAGPS
ncbi:MAG: response regulator [Candidatus Hydrogenedentes bacterium]|nr:response regulator [Candidatus Hydrogenedentota bacterium]